MMSGMVPSTPEDNKVAGIVIKGIMINVMDHITIQHRDISGRHLAGYPLSITSLAGRYPVVISSLDKGRIAIMGAEMEFITSYPTAETFENLLTAGTTNFYSSSLTGIYPISPQNLIDSMTANSKVLGYFNHWS